MKKLILISILGWSGNLLAQNNADKFVGEWEVINKQSNPIKHISIKKVNDNYNLSYNTMPESTGTFSAETVSVSSETYKFKDGYLWDDKNNFKVTYNKATHHINWHNTEWKKTNQ